MVAAGSRCLCHLFSSHDMGLFTLWPLPATSPAQEVPQQHQAALCKPAQGRCRSVPQVKPNAQEPCPEQFVTKQVWLLLYPWRARYRNPFPFLCCQCLSLTMFSSLCSSVPPRQHLLHHQLLLVTIQFRPMKCPWMKWLIHPSQVTPSTHGGGNGHDVSLWGCSWQWEGQ